MCISATGRSVQRVSVIDTTRSDVALSDKNKVVGDEDSEAATPGAKATVVNATVFYAASGCAVGAVVVIVVAIFIFCRCSSRDKKRRHGNLIRRDNSVFRYIEVTPFYFRHVQPSMSTLKPQSNGPLYSNTVIGTLAVDGWVVTFGTARRRLGGAPVYQLYIIGRGTIITSAH